MEEILFALAEIIFEFVLEVVGQLLVEVGVRGAGRALHRAKAHPAWAALGYSILGAALGGLSLVVFPESLIQREWARWLNLALSPVLAGAAMSMLGRILRRTGRRTIRLDSFFYGAMFAFSFVLVRFLFAGS